MHERAARLYCRDLLRAARLTVLRDAEAFPELLFALERMGSLATGEIGDLERYKPTLKEIAGASALCEEVPESVPTYHIPFARLYDLVQRARNDALHQGAFARHLAAHAVKLALILEDALMFDSYQIADFMVRSPVCALPWQPLSFVRQQMLENSFSYLPLWLDDQWRLLSDGALARVLRDAPTPKERKARLTTSVQDAVGRYGLLLEDAEVVSFDAKIPDVLKSEALAPTLVVGDSGELLGIVTPFDLL